MFTYILKILNKFCVTNMKKHIFFSLNLSRNGFEELVIVQLLAYYRSLCKSKNS
jgi:hypothetical protein